ncbi:hypothetical protein B0E52_17465 [Rhodanobacter sp. C06]|uniref:glycosyltransferase n=1 Tax=Rhodanobacter sp. C06 TaxID=1945854 RepID=UPI0009CF9708|nr:glycosyltransferase [Rhodanobacter sp. C06]OOG36089.1 hypothetical protein B0E52_16870 [Rhodanobacter sp. C06]OOG36198.1 hypothetical protein B0E52_17465 [Rhodanobacter sp. C06]
MDSICAIVVTFQPDAEFPDRLDRLSTEFRRVFVIDNASSSLRIREDDKIRVLQNDHNVGIAAALNRGLRDAHAAGYAWAVTFDQDSEPVEGFAEAMLASVRALKTCRLLLGANYVDVHRRRLAHHVGSQRSAPVRRTTLITSGMLLPVGFALAIDGFREDFFIDSVDHEFCLRAADHGAGVFVTREPLMRHAIGAPVAGVRWARALSSAHPASRKYFIARNALWTVRLHAYRHPLWSLRQFARVIAEAVGILLFETGRFTKIGAFLRGIRDGVMVDVRRAR